MMMARRLSLGISALFVLLAAPVSGQDEPEWVEPMREVHARFDGTPGTFAHFGDSITVTLAFWTPMLYERKNASPEMEEAYSLIHGYLQPECWREWKGGEYGNEGMQTAHWATQHIDEWLAKLDPEVALIMFGSNDVNNVGEDGYRAQMAELVDKCFANGTVVILSTIPPRNNFVEKAAEFAQVVRELAAEKRVPLIDFHAEIMQRRPDDWNGAMDKFAEWEGYDVPTLVARDGVHPSHPEAYRSDYSEDALNCCGFSLRNYLALMAYADVLERLSLAGGN